MTDPKTPENIIILAKKWQDGSITEAEKKEFEQWYDATENVFEMSGNETREQAKERIYQSILFKGKIVKNQRRLWPKIAAAASIMMAIGAGLWFYSSLSAKKSLSRKSVYVNDIAPGKNRATLRLANGKTIVLSDAKSGVIINASRLTYNDGTDVQLSSLNVKEQLTATTPRGGIYQLILSDGTKVWLNAASTLKFPSTFKNLPTGQKRNVELNGEAYFEVARDKDHAFVVATAQQRVEVLGTHFNINSYHDEATEKTTLLEGSVKITHIQAAENQQKMLRPGQQAEIRTGIISVRNVDAAEPAAWKDGYFRFDDESMESIMLKVSRWYDVDVVFKDNELKKERYAALTTRFVNVTKLLDKLEQTGIAKFKVEGRTVTISKK